MKEINEIDQLFEASLGGLTVEPSTQSWDKVASGLDAAAVNTAASQTAVGLTRKYILWAILGSVAAILALILSFNQKQTEPEFQEQSISQQGEQILTPSQNTMDNSSIQKNNSELEVSNSNSDDAQSIIQSDQDLSQSDNGYNDPIRIELSNTANTHSETNQEKSTTENSTNTTEKGSNNFNNSSDQVVALEVVQAPSSEQKEIQTEKANGNEVEIMAINSQETKAESSTQNNQVSATPITELTETPKAPENQEVKSNPSKEHVSEKQNQEKPKTEVIETEELVEPTAASIPAPSETSGIRYATGWSMDLYGGPAWILNDEDEVLNENQPISQSGIDQLILTPSIGLNLKYHVNHWFIQSGVAYAEYGENKNYTQQFEMHDTTGYADENINEYYSYDSVGYYIDPNNPDITVTLYDAIKHIDTSYSWVAEDSLYYEHQSIYAQNRFRYIEIPVMVGYEFRFKNLSVELSTGVSVGFRVNSSGKFFDSQNQLIDINSSNSPYSNTMVNYLLSVGLKYHIDNRFSIIAQPLYKTNLSSLFNSGNSVKYNHLGINIGLNYIIK